MSWALTLSSGKVIPGGGTWDGPRLAASNWCARQTMQLRPISPPLPPQPLPPTGWPVLCGEKCPEMG